MYHRQKLILDLLRNGRIEIPATARLLGVSEMTLRRDLRRMEEEKLLLQVRGGAVRYPAQITPDTAMRQLSEVKFRLAERLLWRIMPLETLFIGTGTTCLAFAQTIARSKLPLSTIITHSLPVAAALFQTPHRVILLGGELRSTSMDLLGPVAEKNLEEYQVDWLVSGCDGVFADYGFYTSDVNLSRLERKSISISRRTAVVTESGKFGRRSLTRFATLEEISLIVTDDGVSEDDAKKMRAHGIEVLTVPVGKSKE